MSVVHVVGEPTLKNRTSAARGADSQPGDPIDIWGTLGQAADVFGCDSEGGLGGPPASSPAPSGLRGRGAQNAGYGVPRLHRRPVVLCGPALAVRHPRKSTLGSRSGAAPEWAVRGPGPAAARRAPG
jgi:hypothetical protein